jgi:hypothetical protein
MENPIYMIIVQGQLKAGSIWLQNWDVIATNNKNHWQVSTNSKKYIDTNFDSIDDF